MIFSIHERVELGDHAAGSPGQRVIAFAFDLSDQSLLQIEWRDQQLFQAGITGQARERVENDRHFFRDFRSGGQQAEVGINASGARMVIARAEMDVLAEPIGIASHHEQRLAVCL